MKDKLRQIEARLQQIIESSAARLFTAVDVEDQLAARMVEAMTGLLVTDPDGSINAPHIFSMIVNPKYAQDIRANQALLDSLANTLLAAGEEAGIQFDSHPSINIFPDEEIAEGDFLIWAMRSANTFETQAIESSLEIELEQTRIPPQAFFIVGGSKIFSLEQEVVNIGRKLDNHLVLDDPRVSRNHAQLRAVKGRYILFDLDSSGGTFVNGEKITQAILHPGDVISLAGVPMVFGQDAVRAVNETQEYERPDRTKDSTTANLNLEDLDLDNFDS